MVQAPPHARTDLRGTPGFTAVKVAMLITDVGFLVYWSAALLGLIPAEYAYKDYDDPVMSDWNYSFLPLDVAASATGLASLHLCRRAREGGPPQRVAWRPLMLVSLTLTSTAGLQAVVFWALRGDWSPTWWIPNLALLLFPVPAIARLLRHEDTGAPVR
ncbi:MULTISPECIES: DUF5360 family protein [Streptomyces]|uniref:Uncharacterized protein n=1 Tax=Streptomyces alboflavus TaxID=67267 RepID=A0A1Z1WJB0_9ACTN|nr:DUF5360 family protein [Streptomyces alboflavus]ARX86535.1 hypothetical protein SMD44_06007 [Streptomyces alboflavus]